jgi:phage terminase small subunit
MENLTRITLELGINAQKIIQQVQIHNKNIESEITKGIEMALEEMMTANNFVDMIKESTKKEIENIAKNALVSWELKNKIQQLVNEKVGKKLEEYADKIADKITESLK